MSTQEIQQVDTNAQSPQPIDQYKPDATAIVKANHNCDTVGAGGTCPDRAKEIGIFPVRYAVDENLFLENIDQNLKTVEDWQKLATTKGNNKLPEKWLNEDLPKLNTREYTLRQLRAGWLYVWTSQNKLEEYKINNPVSINDTPSFSKVDLEANKEKDERKEGSEKQTLLYFPKNTKVFMAYSPVQWTWRVCELMQKNINYSKWMRQIDLTKYLPNHTDTIENIGKVVADIFIDKVKANFKASVVATSAMYQTEGKALISLVSADKILAASKNQQADLFVALDDPLGIIDDLLLTLNHPVDDKNNYEHENQRKTRIAQIAYPMSGLGIDEFIPDAIAANPADKYQYLKDLVDTKYLDWCHEAFKAEEEKAIAAALHATTGQPPLPNLGAGRASLYKNNIEAELANNWIPKLRQASFGSEYLANKGYLPKESITTKTASGEERTITWKDKVAEWDKISTLRRNLKLSEALAHLKDREVVLQIFNQCIEKVVEDTLAWLDKLSPDADEIFHDVTLVQQSTDLYEHAEKIITLIQEHDKGRNWLVQQLKKPESLFALSFFNFNQNLYKLFTRAAEEISKDGAINQVGNKQREGGVNLNDKLANNILSRVSDTIGVLSDEQLKNWPGFKQMDVVAQKAYGTLQKLFAGTAGRLYENLIIVNLFNFALFQPKELLPYATVITMAPAENMTVCKNLRFRDEFLEWTNKVHRIETRIAELSAANRELSSKGRTTKADHLENRQQINANKAERAMLQSELRNLQAQKPIPFIATVKTEQTFKGTVDFFYKQSGQQAAIDRAWDKLESAIKARQATTKFINEYKGSVLPAIFVVWNLYNTKQAIAEVKSYPNPKDYLNVISNIAYLGQAVMTLWMGPLWDRYSKAIIQATTGTRVMTLQNMSKITLANLKNSRPFLAAIAPKIITRIGILNGFLAVGSLAELGTVWSDIDSSSNSYEKWGQRLKFTSVAVSALIGVGSLGNGILFLMFDCAWIFGPWAVAVLFGAGIVYLLASIWIQYFHREGLALWLDNCIWGEDSKWQGNDEQTQLAELKALYKVLLEPSVAITPTRKFIDSEIDDNSASFYYKNTGFWLQFALPVELKDNQIAVKTLLVRGNGLLFANTAMESEYQHFMGRIGKYGVWTDPHKDLGKDLSLDPITSEDMLPEAYDYDSHMDFNRYIYTVWIPYEIKDKTFLGLRLDFPMDFNQPANLLNAPLVDETVGNSKITLSFSYETKLRTGVDVHMLAKDLPTEKLDEAKQDAKSFYINQPRFAQDVVTYLLQVGQPDAQRK